MVNADAPRQQLCVKLLAAERKVQKNSLGIENGQVGQTSQLRGSANELEFRCMLFFV